MLTVILLYQEKEIWLLHAMRKKSLKRLERSDLAYKRMIDILTEG